MANRERGEVDYCVTGEDGHERRYTLRLSTNAICEMQTRMNKTYGEIVNSLSSVDMVALRELLLMLLKKHHGKEFTDVEAVGDLIDEGGGPSSVVQAVTELFLLNQPKEAQEPKAKKGRAVGPQAA